GRGPTGLEVARTLPHRPRGRTGAGAALLSRISSRCTARLPCGVFDPTTITRRRSPSLHPRLRLPSTGDPATADGRAEASVVDNGHCRTVLHLRDGRLPVVAAGRVVGRVRARDRVARRGMAAVAAGGVVFHA